MEKQMISDTISIYVSDYNNESNSLIQLIKSLEISKRWLDEHHPEWLNHEVRIGHVTDMNENLELIIEYERYMTNEEYEYSKNQKERDWQDDARRLKELIKKYPSEAQEIIEQYKRSVIFS